MTHQDHVSENAARAARRRAQKARARAKLDRTVRDSLLWSQPILAPGQPPTLRLILLAIEEHTGLTLRDLLSPSRYADIVRARQMYYWLARRLTKQSTVKIGLICGGKDHSTVLHGIAKVNRLRDTFEPELSELLEILTPRGGEVPQ